jgi:hypothetical protein
MKQASETQAKQAARSENTEQVGNEAAKLEKSQEKLDGQVDDVRDAIRRDANVQNMATQEGRERARDADDAVAMLRQQTPDAADLLGQAATASEPKEQKGSLEAAADQQGKLADKLDQLAEHYKNLEEGRPEPTRTALRNAEKDTGLKSTLDAEYAKAKVLEDLAGKSPQDQLATLERALPSNQPMRHELSDISKDALAEAAADLQQSADSEQKMATDLGQSMQGESGQKQPSPAEQAKQIADAARKMAQEKVPELASQSKKAGVNNRPELDHAAESLSAAAKDMPTDFNRPAQDVAPAVAEQANRLQQAASDLANAAGKVQQPGTESQQAARQNTQQAGQQAEQLARQAKQLANALSQVQKAADQQPGIEQAVREAGNDIERVGRHEARLGNESMGEQLAQLGQQVENQVGAQIEQAGETLEKATAPAQAQPVVQGAHDAIEKPLEQLAAAMQQAQPGAQQNAAAPQDASSQLASTSEETSKWMARALDSLDQALNPASQSAESQQGQQGQPEQQAGQPQQGQPEQGQQGQQGQSQQGQPQQGGQPEQGQQGQQGQEASQQAMASAAESQASSMMEARTQGLVPGEQPLSQQPGSRGGGNVRADMTVYGKVPTDASRLAREWGKLPPKLARDLLDSQREGVGGEYREMVNLYFRAVAEKAKGQRK